MIKLMHSGQTTQLFLIIDVHANFHSDSALYPDSGFQSDSSPQGGTEWSSSPQHNDDLSPLKFFFCILFHTMAFFFNNAFYKLKQTKFLCLSSNLSYPEDLKKQWLPFSILSLLPFLISPSLSSIPSCSSDQFSVFLR